jgi:tetratricopeptide (TPR) repeat protein
MLRFGNRGRLLLLFALAVLLPTAILYRRGLRPFASPSERAESAYARGDWATAVNLARACLKTNAKDVAALRLLARGLIRLGRHSAALSVYERVGRGAMAADDLCLLGIALTRSGNSRGIELWERARQADPDHAETLFELTRAYRADGRLARAAETGRRLASRPGWRRPAEILLGEIDIECNDPAGAVAHWLQALHQLSADQLDAAPSMALRKNLARALLQLKRPAEARHHLQAVLSTAPDQETSWLLSRTFLQEDAPAEVLATLEKAGSFRDEHPVLPEPAPFVGSAACAGCHPALYRAQQSSRHSRTFFRAAQLAGLKLPAGAFPDPVEGAVTHTLARTNGGGLRQETRARGQVFHAVVDYAFGSGDHGLTLIGHDEKSQPRELRLSRYLDQARTLWDVTSGHAERPQTPAGYLGRLLSADALRHCFECHVTDPRAVQEGTSPLADDRGIGCEQCHGPGGNHELAVKAQLPDLAIARPTLASGARVVQLCARCHSKRGQPILPDDPASVRFPGTTLTWSRCFTQSTDTLDCVTCHDPHRNVEKSSTHFEARCLACHAGVSRSPRVPHWSARSSTPEASPSIPCPVNPVHGCITCHMPSVKNVFPHTSFTDHFIRVHRD